MNLRQLLKNPNFIILTMSLGLGLRLLFLLVFQSEPISDFADYHELAASIAAGDGYAVNGVPTAFRPMGWPALLGMMYAVTGVIPFVGQLFTLLMSMGLLWLGYLLGKQLSGKEEVGRIVLLLLVVHPNGIAYGQLLSAEIPFLLLVLGGALLISQEKSWKWIALSGMIFGLATLVKSQGLFLPLIFAVAFLMNKKAERRRAWVKKLAIIYLFVGITLAPWLIRNYLVFDSFPTLVTNGSANLLVGNNPFANGKYKWGDLETVWYTWQEPPQITGELPEAQKARTLAFNYIRKNPGKTLQRIPKKLWYTYAHDYEGLDWLRESCGGLSGWRHRLIQAFKAFGQMLYLIILFFAFRASTFSLFSLVPHPSSSKISLIASPLLRLSFLLLLYFSLIVIVIFGDGRFHFPLMPFLFLLAAVQLIPSNSLELPNEQAQV